MAAGPLSAVNLVAGAGLLQNTGLDVNPELVTELAKYNATTVASAFTAVVNKAIALNTTFTPTNPVPPPDPLPDPPPEPYVPTPENVTLPFTNATLIRLQKLAADSVPALSNVVPTKYFNSYVPPLWDEDTPYKGGSQVTWYGQIWLATLDNIGVSPLDELARFEEELPDTKPTWVVLQSNLLLSRAIDSMAKRIMGYDLITPTGPDVSKFAQVLALSKGFAGSVNQFVGGINNSASAAATFTDMDSISTGGISQLSSDSQSYGLDSQSIGTAVNLERLDALGLPSALLYNVFQAGGLLPEIQDLMSLSGISIDDIEAISENPLAATDNVNRQLYVIMLTITGSLLSQVLELLDVTTPGITSMADLLNPVKLLPNSYSTLTTTGLDGKPIPVYAGTSPNPLLATVLVSDPLLSSLALIIPPDQAAANRAWARALGQINNVSGLSMPGLSVAASFVEPLKSLPLIAGLTQLIPDTVKNNIKNTLTPSTVTPTATGDGGTMTTMDLVGTAAGVPHVECLKLIVPEINRLQSSSRLTALNSAYTVMNSVLNGAFGPVDIGPIEGLPAPFDTGEPFAGADECFNDSLIPRTETIISTIAADNPVQTPILKENWDKMGAQIARESINQRGAEINFASLEANNKNATMSLTTSLHDLGSDITGGTAMFFEKVAGATSQAGQGILASLREGRNIKVLQNIGVGIMTNLPK
jgi:hypothetical protein